MYALLAVIRLFLVPGAVGTSQNQAAFWQHGILYHALQLAFSHDAEMSIRAEVRASPHLTNIVKYLFTCDVGSNGVCGYHQR